MTLLRALLSDLVERRLWPIALLLAITAVAVPVVLGHGGSPAAAPVASPAAATTDAVASPVPAVEIVGPASVRSRSGRVRDPFRRTAKAPARTATVDGAPAAQDAGAGSTSKSGAADTPTAATATATAPTTTTAAGGVRAADAPARTGPSVYRTRVRWGQDAKADVRGVSRLEPLGGLSNPALLYLGTTKAGARAVFLLGPNAGADGQGTCAEKTCRVVRLKAGDKTVVTVAGADGAEPRRYTLVIDDIVRSVAGGEAAAAKLRARVDRDGRDVLREMIKDARTAAAIGQFGFDRSLGAVVATSAP
jgi:hypothetical protein